MTRHATPAERAAARARVASHYTDPVTGACLTCEVTAIVTGYRVLTCRWCREIRT